jgi:hypothetical protein
VVTRVTPAGNQTPGTPAPASFANGVAGGWIGYVETTTSSGLISTTSEVDIAGLAVSVTVNSSRRIRITVSCRVDFNNAAGDRWIIKIKEGSTIFRVIRGPYASFNPSEFTAFGAAIETPTAGSHTYKATIQRFGTNSIEVPASADEPAYLLVEDLGPA